MKRAREVGGKYIGAWIAEDYRSMFALQSRRTTKDYEVFRKMAIVWRTRGFPQREALTPGKRTQIVSTMEPVLNLTDEEAQILLVLAVCDKSAVDLLKAKRWPERVLVMRVVIGSDVSGLLFGMENGDWKPLTGPGMLGPELMELESRK